MEYKELLKIHRRELHKIPELGRELPMTKAYIMGVLKGLNCEITDVLEYGLCAYFDFGKESTTALRADMDALPVLEKCTHDFVSQHEGRMHACGHDGHMSILLTFCAYLDQAENLNSNVLCIFQPAEETTGGAHEICETGIMEKYSVTRCFGLHLWPGISAGKIGSKPGAFMPRSSEVTVGISGKSAHATSPEEGIDALYTSALYLQRIYEKHQALSENVTFPEDRTILQICRMESGTARNIIAKDSSLLGTMRAFDEDKFNRLLDIIEGTAKELETETGCRINVGHSEGYPPVINDEKLYEEILPVLESRFDYIEFEKPAMISEDYSFYGHYVPSVYFFLGTDTDMALHSDDFDFDEDILMSGFNLYRELTAK